MKTGFSEIKERAKCLYMVFQYNHGSLGSFQWLPCHEQILIKWLFLLLSNNNLSFDNNY
jgi:hypothetical protein